MLDLGEQLHCTVDLSRLALDDPARVSLRKTWCALAFLPRKLHVSSCICRINRPFALPRNDMLLYVCMSDRVNVARSPPNAFPTKIIFLTHGKTRRYILLQAPTTRDFPSSANMIQALFLPSLSLPYFSAKERYSLDTTLFDSMHLY